MKLDAALLDILACPACKAAAARRRGGRGAGLHRLRPGLPGARRHPGPARRRGARDAVTAALQGPADLDDAGALAAADPGGMLLDIASQRRAGAGGRGGRRGEAGVAVARRARAGRARSSSAAWAAPASPATCSPPSPGRARRAGAHPPRPRPARLGRRGRPRRRGVLHRHDRGDAVRADGGGAPRLPAARRRGGGQPARRARRPRPRRRRPGAAGPPAARVGLVADRPARRRRRRPWGCCRPAPTRSRRPRRSLEQVATALPARRRHRGQPRRSRSRPSSPAPCPSCGAPRRSPAPPRTASPASSTRTPARVAAVGRPAGGRRTTRSSRSTAPWAGGGADGGGLLPRPASTTPSGPGLRLVLLRDAVEHPRVGAAGRRGGRPRGRAGGRGERAARRGARPARPARLAGRDHRLRERVPRPARGHGPHARRRHPGAEAEDRPP